MTILHCLANEIYLELLGVGERCLSPISCSIALDPAYQRRNGNERNDVRRDAFLQRNILSQLRSPLRPLSKYLAFVIWLMMTICSSALLVGQPQTRGAIFRSNSLASAKSGPPRNMVKPPQDEIIASGWQTPQRGWLYVMDYNSALSGSDGQVLLVDPINGHVVGRLIVGSVPDMVLSPNGKRLYVASILNTGDTLAVIDTINGAVLQSVPIHDRAKYTSMPGAPMIAISPDGLWVYLLKMRTISRLHDEFTVASFDVARGVFLPDEAVVPGCVSGLIFPSPDSQHIRVLCRGSNDVHFLLQTQSGLQALPPPFPLRSPGELQMIPTTGALSPKGNILAFGSHADGILEVLEIEVGTGPAGRVLAQLSDNWVPARGVAQSPDLGRLYVAVGQVSKRSTGKAESVLILDARTGQELKRWRTNHSFWSLAISPDGQRLYQVDHESQTIFEFDTTTYQEVRTINGIGRTPSRIVVAP
jgi:YVTN family beta-propeller protein